MLLFVLYSIGMIVLAVYWLFDYSFSDVKVYVCIIVVCGLVVVIFLLRVTLGFWFNGFSLEVIGFLYVLWFHLVFIL